MRNLGLQCKRLIKLGQYEECEKVICHAMFEHPHSALPHNLMGILLEKENRHVEAMKHFRAAKALDPEYMPASYNLEYYASGRYQTHIPYRDYM